MFLDKWAPYFDSLKPLGLRCSVVCVMWWDVGGAGAKGFRGVGGGAACKGMHFSQSKIARLLNCCNYSKTEVT